MSEVLSQNEIDNLLAALSTGELDADTLSDTNEKQVKNYDFKRPAKFSKEHLRTLEIIHEHYGRLLSTNLPVYLRKTVQVAVASSETVTFSEFTNALASPSILGIINFHPLNGTIILDMAPNLGFAMIDRMLGGQGEALERSRDFSEIEMTILQKMMVVCMQLMRDPWKNVVEVNPVLDRIETNPAFAQIISPSDMIAIVTLTKENGALSATPAFGGPWFADYNAFLRRHKGETLVFVYAGWAELVLTPDGGVYNPQGTDVSRYLEGVENPYAIFQCDAASYVP